MKPLRNGDSVVVYHKISPEIEHTYYFYDMEDRIDLIWGETGHIPNYEDRFDHPKKDISLRLANILWSEDDLNYS